MKKHHTLKSQPFRYWRDAYWEQFQGLKERLESYLKIVSNRVGEFNSVKKGDYTVSDRRFGRPITGRWNRFFSDLLK